MKTLISVICTILVAGCSSSSSVTKNSNFSESGSLVIARQAPSVFNGEAAHALGFMPLTSSGSEVLIHPSDKTIELLINGAPIDKIQISDSITLGEGVYSVLLKQENPMWYATEEYYNLRGLPVPAEGSRERYLKGALGSNVLFLTPEIFLSDAPYYSPEVGGIVISDKEAFSRFYSALSVGAKVTVLN